MQVFAWILPEFGDVLGIESLSRAGWLWDRSSQAVSCQYEQTKGIEHLECIIAISDCILYEYKQKCKGLPKYISTIKNDLLAICSFYFTPQMYRDTTCKRNAAFESQVPSQFCIHLCDLSWGGTNTLISCSIEISHDEVQHLQQQWHTHHDMRVPAMAVDPFENATSSGLQLCGTNLFTFLIPIESRSSVASHRFGSSPFSNNMFEQRLCDRFQKLCGLCWYHIDGDGPPPMHAMHASCQKAATLMHFKVGFNGVSPQEHFPNGNSCCEVSMIRLNASEKVETMETGGGSQLLSIATS